jgi:hypothetical protein
VKLRAGKGLIQPCKPFVNRVPKLGFDLRPAIFSGSVVGCGCTGPSVLDGGSPETSSTVQVCLPLVQLPSFSRGSKMAIMGLIDGGNLSKVSPVVMVLPQNSSATLVHSQKSPATLVHSQKSPEISVQHRLEALVLPLPSDGVLDGVASSRLLSAYGLGRQGDGEVGEALYSPLCIYPPIALGDSSYSDWAFHCVKEICPIVGISCVGHE